MWRTRSAFGLILSLSIIGSLIQMTQSEDFEEDYGAVDIMSSLERDIGNLFHKITLALKKRLITNSWEQLKFLFFSAC